MDELRELYQEMILDHYRKPRNFGKLGEGTRHAEGYNPLCGDKVTVFIALDGDSITDVAFEGSGCAICMASSSIMTEALKGKTISEAEALFGRFHDLVTGEPDTDTIDALGKLAVFAGVREYPIRVKCATLPWHTMQAAVESKDNVVTTE